MNVTTIKAHLKTFDNKIIYSISAVSVLAVLGIGGLTFGKAVSESAQPIKDAEPLAVSTLTLAPQSVASVVSAAGTLNSKNTSILASKIMGKVTELTVHEGDHVTAGQQLLRIESGEISAQVYQAQAALNNAKLHYDRIKSLFDQKASTQMEMDQATLGFESAKAGLSAAKAMESYTIITAPISGQIVEKKVNLGELALPGAEMLKIEDNRNLRLEVTVAEQDLGHVQIGKPVIVRIDALEGKELKARVAQIVPAADSRTHSFLIKIDVPADKTLITGMYGKVFFSTGTRNAILVPRSAVVTMSGLTGVYLVSTAGNAVFQMIQLGEELGNNVEAVTGLKQGDRIIVNNQNTHLDGKKIVVAVK